jgi:hypothetical protein
MVKKNRWDAFREALSAAETPEEAGAAIYRYPGKSNEIFSEVARLVRAWDEGLVLATLAADQGGALARNPHLPAWAHARLARWAVSRLQGEAAEAPIAVARATLEPLIQGGHLPLDSAEGRALLEVVFGRGQRKVQAHSLALRQVVALSLLLDHPGLPGEVADRAHDEIYPGLRAEMKLGVLVHPNLSLERRRATVQRLLSRVQTGVRPEGKDPHTRDLLRKLIGYDRIRRDEQIRPALWTWLAKSSHVLEADAEAFLADADLPDHPSVARGVIAWIRDGRLGEWGGIRVLHRCGDALAPHLDPEDLREMLSSPSPELRLQAIRLSAQVPRPSYRADGGAAAPRSDAAPVVGHTGGPRAPFGPARR